MTYYIAGLPYSANDLYHHGIKGQRWGVRRFQNADGTRTPAGKARYSGSNTEGSSESSGSSSGKSKLKTALKVGAVVAGTALVAYGGYKLSKAVGKTDFSTTANHGQSTIHDMLNNNLADLNNGLSDSSSRAKGAVSELSRMSDQLRTGNIPKPPTPSQIESIVSRSQNTYNEFVNRNAAKLNVDPNAMLRANSERLKAQAEAMKRSASSSKSNVSDYTSNLLNNQKRKLTFQEISKMTPEAKRRFYEESQKASQRQAKDRERRAYQEELSSFMRTMNITDPEKGKQQYELYKRDLWR